MDCPSLERRVLTKTFLHLFFARAVIPCLSGTFHRSGVDAVVSSVFFCEITLSCGQEVNSMCDNSQTKIQDSVSALWTKAGWAELGLGGVEGAGLGYPSVA